LLVLHILITCKQVEHGKRPAEEPENPAPKKPRTQTGDDDDDDDIMVLAESQSLDRNQRDR